MLNCGMNAVIKLTKHLITVGAASLISKVQQMLVFPCFPCSPVFTRVRNHVRHSVVFNKHGINDFFRFCVIEREWHTTESTQTCGAHSFKRFMSKRSKPVKVQWCHV